MMPSEFRHQKISIFADLETLKKDERARRRILRIQQVRQQSKLVASQVIARSRTLREKEEDLLRQQKEEKLKDWKHQRLSSLRDELDYGIEYIGESYKAVDKELEALKQKQDKKLISENLARKRGLIAAREVQRETKEDILKEERHQRDRENLRTLENTRAKAIANLPISISEKSESSTNIPTLNLPNTSRSSQEKTTRSSSTGQYSGNKVEVYNFSQPHQQQYTNLPDNIVQKLTPSTCKVSATKQAEEELKAQIELEQQQAKKEQLSFWLGTAAGARKSLQKEYDNLIARLPALVQQETLTRPDAPVTLSEITEIEQQKKCQRKPSVKKVTIVEPPVQNMEPHQNGHDASSHMNFTEFPATQFTEEEAGALGATASSLQVLLDNLAGESRRRLQEVVYDDDFEFYDEDFDEPPPESPPPPTQQVVSSRKVTLDVKTTHQVVVEGTPPSSPPTITSTSEVNVTVTSKSKNKRRKKKSKTNAPPNEEALDEVDKDNLPSSSKIEQAKPSKKKSKKKSQTKTTTDIPKPNVQDLSNIESESSASNVKEPVVKSVEIDEQGVAYIKKTSLEDKVDNQDISVTEHVTGAVRKEFVQGQTSFSEDYKYNKQSFVSNSTQYHSPPEDLLADENINKYLKSIEKEKAQVESFLQLKGKQKQATSTASNIDLPQYIGKLLTMTRDSVDQLSVSDVTETSSEVSGSRKKKKKKTKKKTIESISSSTSSEMLKSPSTEDSQVSVSLPSSGLAVTPESVSGSVAQLSSSTSLDSKLKFSDSSSNKESSNSDDSKPAYIPKLGSNISGPLQTSDELDSTAYLSLQDISSRVPTKVSYGQSSKSVNIHIDLSNLPPTLDQSNASNASSRLPDHARLSTIVEADSSVVADEEKSVAIDSSSSILDVEAELRKRGLPTLVRSENTKIHADTLLSPELEKKLQDMNVVPWSVEMLRRMNRVESLSSSSDEIQPRMSDSSCSEQAARTPIEPGISHSTPVSMDTGTSTTQQTQRFFLQDSVVSPIAPSEEKLSPS